MKENKKLQELELKESSSLKILKGVTFTILLGAIGSGIWEVFLFSASTSLVNYVSRFFLFISNSYADYFYRNIGDGIKEVFSYYPYIFMMGATILLGLHVIYSIININFFNNEKKISNLRGILRNKSYSKTTDFLLLVIVVGGIFYIVGTTTKHIYTYNTIIYIEKSIDILAPHVDQNEILKLRAEYRMIDNYSKFENFNEKLKSISNSKNVELPAYKLIIK